MSFVPFVVIVRVVVHNLRPVLERLHAGGEPLNLAGDFHYNEKLSRACAEHIWAALLPALSRRAPLASHD